MSEVFIDTAGWATAFVRTEPRHIIARELLGEWRRHGVKAVTTNYVLIELFSLLISPLKAHHPLRMSIIESIQTSSWIEVVWSGPVLDGEAWELLKQRPDKTWSFVDAVSFIVMRRRGIVEALTSDHHFEQAGFVRLLK